MRNSTEKGRIFFANFQLQNSNVDGMREIENHHQKTKGNTLCRQEPLMDAKINNRKCEKKEGYLHSLRRVSKYFLQTLINYKGKNSKFIVEKPRRYHFNQG